MSRVRGVVKFFKDDKGYGFVRRDDNGADVFLHISDLKIAGLVEQGGGADIGAGDHLEFELGQGKNGKGEKAINIKALD